VREFRYFLLIAVYFRSAIAMTSQQDIKINLSDLEQKVQKLINLHEDLKKVNKRLLTEKRKMTLELQEAREKTRRMEEGYKNLKEIEKTSSRQSITNMKRKINDIILEIDRNMSMMEDKSYK
jgi:hypothetical protein